MQKWPVVQEKHIKQLALIGSRPLSPPKGGTKRDFAGFASKIQNPVVRASEKVQLLLIGSRQCAFYRAIDEPCALPLIPPMGCSKRELLHVFALPFISSFPVIIDTSNLICRLIIASPSL